MSRVACLFLIVTAAWPSPARAQQSASDVLSFLLINRSVVTGDFARDEVAAAATRDALVAFVLAELSTLPTSSPAGGFTYRLDPSLGTSVRSSDSFGPFFLQRSLTGGRRQISFGLISSYGTFDGIDGRSLRDGTLVATGARIVGDVEPFDAETLTLRIQTSTTTVVGHAGLTDRLDLDAAVPFLMVRLTGSRIDTYRGTAVVQATAAAVSSGIGDVRLGAKYNAFRDGGSGLALTGEITLPTGDTAELRGSGVTVFTPRVIGSLEIRRIGLHGNLGYEVGRPATQIHGGGAMTIAVSPRLTVITEALGQRVSSGGQLVELVEPHPLLSGIETIRLSSVDAATTRAQLVAGVRWNLAARGLLGVNVLKPLTTAGLLNTRWVATLSFDYILGN